MDENFLEEQCVYHRYFQNESKLHTVNQSLPLFNTKPNVTISNCSACNTSVKNTEPPSKFSIMPEENVIVINISGKKYETYLTTIERFPNTLLGNPEKRKHYYNPITREYFFDRHRKAFNGILNYYQSSGLLEKPEAVSEKIFTQEVMFFELGEMALQFENDCNAVNCPGELNFPSNPLFRTIWIMFEYPKSSRIAQFLTILSISIILLSIVVFCIETIPSLDPDHKEGEHMKTTWLVLNSICNFWFTLEYLIRFIVAPDRFFFARSILNIIDLVSIMPYYLGFAFDSKASNYIIFLKVIRILRIVRIFKLSRHARGLHVLASTIKASIEELVMLVMFLAIGAILFASAVYFAESTRENSNFKSIPHSLWWAIVTMTTVGYGDVVPTTLIGKIIGTFCAISGVLVIAIPVPVIVSNFEHFYKEEHDRRAREEEISKRESLTKKMSPMKDTLRILKTTSVLLSEKEKNSNGKQNNISLITKS
ncbi:potassium voltage-gated channel subfamily A member 10 [Hydra vulgaris]|uniref:Potassium voltage-gated channel subfamily A member 10 n=1 Tax=Hydra vulgaris TaxID=6087 RepID=A0ABM4CNV6_HYDVU